MKDHILLRHRDIPSLGRFQGYLEHGGFAAFRAAVTRMTPEAVVEEVKQSGLRGRGGAGFPTGMKWSYLAPGMFPCYLVANGDESEPGTYKDRELLEGNPFQVLEGMMIAAYAIQANLAFLYLRGEFFDLSRQIETCLTDLRQNHLLGTGLFGSEYSLDIRVHLGAGAYICGEESALLESIEGKRGQPRLKPPFPVQKGLYGQPTVINNVETLANIPFIVGSGAAAFRRFGTEKSPGTKVFCLSGKVRRPGNYELPLGATFRELIETGGGGPAEGRRLKGLLPSGASSCVLPANDAVLDCPMEYESVSQAGSALGSGSVIVFDDSVDAAWLALGTTRFFERESCGKCTPCRAGLRLVRQMLEDILAGESGSDDLAHLERICRTIQLGSFCALGQSAPNAVLSSLRHFRADFESHLGKPS
jgi:NADH-quinone oxidoreductase subunit F